MNAGAGILHVEETAAVGAGADTAPLVVMVHGSMDRGASFARTARRLRDARILRYDRRGYAGSFRAGPPASFEQQVDDLACVLDGRPAVALGHSFGGDVVLAAASRHPDLIRAAVAWEPPMPWEPWWPPATPAARAGRSDESPEAVAEAFMVGAVGRRIWTHLPEVTRRQRLAEGPTLVAELVSLRAGRPFDPAAVRCPVTVGCGTDSQPYQRRTAEHLASVLPAATLATVAGSAHGVHLSHPAELAALVRGVLARVCGKTYAPRPAPQGRPAGDTGGPFPCV